MPVLTPVQADPATWFRTSKLVHAFFNPSECLTYVSVFLDGSCVFDRYLSSAEIDATFSMHSARIRVPCICYTCDETRWQMNKSFSEVLRSHTSVPDAQGSAPVHS